MTKHQTDVPPRPVVLTVAGAGEYQLSLIAGISSVLRKNGTPLIVHVGDPSLRGVPVLLERLLRHEAPAGILTTSAASPADEEALLDLVNSLGIPAVHVGQEVPGGANVNGDAVGGMRALMAHLLDECGVRRPVLVRGIVHQPDSVARERVFREQMRRRKLPVDEDLVVDGLFVPDITYKVMSPLLKRRRDMDGVVALNDSSAFAVLDALADAGIRVPDDVVVTGFDDELGAAARWPGLTSVCQDVAGQGTLAASLLLDQIQGNRRQGDFVVPSRLVIRGSTVSGGPRTEEQLRSALDASLEANRLMQTQLAEQHTLLTLNRALFRCRSADEVAAELAPCLDCLGIVRCRLAIYEVPADGGRANEAAEYARILLDYRDGTARPPPDTLFAAHRLLPEQLRDELQTGTAVLLPLTGLDRDLGYLLLEQARGSVTAIEVLRHDLSRALEAVFGAQERDDYTANLERLVARRTRKLERANAELQRSSMLDGLTQIANRVAFERHLERHWKAQAGHGQHLALLIVDVDLFKAYNDRYGHVLGDEALRIVAGCLKRAARRPTDLAARYGGEEFAVVLPNSDTDAAAAVASRFRGLLAAAAIPHATSCVAPVVTASVGIAAAPACPESDPFVLVKAADRALYRAKALGRDRVAVEHGYADGASPVAGTGRAA